MADRVPGLAQLVGAISKYDPDYTAKVKQVVEAIDNELSKEQQFTVADVGRYMDIDCDRYIRMLCRRGFLTSFEGAGRGFPYCLHRPPPCLEVIRAEDSARRLER